MGLNDTGTAVEIDLVIDILVDLLIGRNTDCALAVALVLEGDTVAADRSREATSRASRLDGRRRNRDQRTDGQQEADHNRRDDESDVERVKHRMPRSLQPVVRILTSPPSGMERQCGSVIECPTWTLPLPLHDHFCDRLSLPQGVEQVRTAER